MLKNTKIVGIAAAFTLLTGVAFAPSASAIGDSNPEQSLDAGPSFDSNERIEFSVGVVRTGCNVTTKVGPRSVTNRARQDANFDTAAFGIVNSFVKAPTLAGNYTMQSVVSNTCASDAGYRFPDNMADEITVGDEVEMNEDFEDLDNTKNGGLTGTMEDAGTPTDLGKIKISVYRLGVLVASGTTNTSGEFSLQIMRKHFNNAGQTRFTVKIAANELFYIEDGIQVIFANIGDIS